MAGNTQKGPKLDLATGGSKTNDGEKGEKVTQDQADHRTRGNQGQDVAGASKPAYGIQTSPPERAQGLEDLNAIDATLTYSDRKRLATARKHRKISQQAFSVAQEARRTSLGAGTSRLGLGLKQQIEKRRKSLISEGKKVCFDDEIDENRYISRSEKMQEFASDTDDMPDVPVTMDAYGNIHDWTYGEVDDTFADLSGKGVNLGFSKPVYQGLDTSEFDPYAQADLRTKGVTRGTTPEGRKTNLPTPQHFTLTYGQQKDTTSTPRSATTGAIPKAFNIGTGLKTTTQAKVDQRQEKVGRLKGRQPAVAKRISEEGISFSMPQNAELEMNWVEGMGLNSLTDGPEDFMSEEYYVHRKRAYLDLYRFPWPLDPSAWNKKNHSEIQGAAYNLSYLLETVSLYAGYDEDQLAAVGLSAQNSRDRVLCNQPPLIQYLARLDFVQKRNEFLSRLQGELAKRCQEAVTVENIEKKQAQQDKDQRRRERAKGKQEEERTRRRQEEARKEAETLSPRPQPGPPTPSSQVKKGTSAQGPTMVIAGSPKDQTARKGSPHVMLDPGALPNPNDPYSLRPLRSDEPLSSFSESEVKTGTYQGPGPARDPPRPVDVQAKSRGNRQMISSMVSDEAAKHQAREYYQHLRRIPKVEEILQNYWIRDLGNQVYKIRGFALAIALDRLVEASLWAMHCKELVVKEAMKDVWAVGAPALWPDNSKTIQTQEWMVRRGYPDGYISSTCCDLSTYTTGSGSDSQPRKPLVSPLRKQILHKRISSIRKSKEESSKEDSDKVLEDDPQTDALHHHLPKPKGERRSVSLNLQHKKPTIALTSSVKSDQKTPAISQMTKALDSDLENSEEETVEQINETILKLGPIESIHYAVKKLGKNCRATPGGWEAFMECREMGSDPWVAANLPKSPLTGSAKFYKDVMYYSYGMDPVRWMAYYSTILEKQRQYKWSALQLGVVLATYIRGAMMQTLVNELSGDKIYNIYQLLAALDKWDLSQEKCRKSCKEVWSKRVQKSGESISTYGGELQYLANLMYPNDKTKHFQQRLMEKFVTGIHRRYKVVQQVLGGSLDEYVYYRDLLRKAVKLEKYYETEQNDVEALGHALSRARTETFGISKGETNRFEMDLGGVYKVDEWDPANLDPQEIATVQAGGTGEKKNSPSGSTEASSQTSTNLYWRAQQKKKSMAVDPNTKCFNCDKTGHMRFDCTKAPQPGKEKMYATPMNNPAIERRRLAYLLTHKIKLGSVLRGTKINKSKAPIDLVQDWGDLQTSEEEML
jgi:hypothetical protein